MKQHDPRPSADLLRRCRRFRSDGRRGLSRLGWLGGSQGDSDLAVAAATGSSSSILPRYCYYSSHGAAKRWMSVTTTFRLTTLASAGMHCQLGLHDVETDVRAGLQADTIYTVPDHLDQSFENSTRLFHLTAAMNLS